MTPLWCKRLSTAVVALCLVSEAHGADIAIVPDASPYTVPALSSVFRTIRLNGPIESGDAVKLRDLLLGLTKTQSMPTGALVIAELNSESGDYVEAMKVGELFRDFFVTTVVRKNDQCQSGCVLAFLGGTSVSSAPAAKLPSRYIEVGAKFRFRNYYAGARSATSQASEYPVRTILEYSDRMGVERGFTIQLLAYDVGQILDIDTVEKFQALRACPIGLGPLTTSPATQAANLCNQSTGRFDPNARLTTTAMTDAEFRRQLLDYAEKKYLVVGRRG